MSCHCNAPTVWDDQALSKLCSNCGLLLDSSQSLLVSQDVQPSLPAATLKAFRTNWALPGQGKDARNRKNEYVISHLIKSLAVSLNAPGLAPRAIHLFLQVLSAGLRWGTQAKRTAAVCLAFALREAKRPHHLRDIATLVNEPFPALSRAFLSLSSQLRLRFNPSDPSIYISSLHSYLDSLMQDSSQNPPMSASLIAQLRPLDIQSVQNTAYSLCTLLMRSHGNIASAAPPMACAIYLLALESEARHSLHNVGDLAQCLGAKYHVAKGTVMSRYKLFQDEVNSWIEQIPWLDKYRSTGGRAKVSRRTIVARGLKDAVLVQDRRSMDTEDSQSENCRSKKRRKTNHTTRLQSVAAFLLDPNNPSSRDISFSFASVREMAPLILTLPSESIASPAPPTRLQRLAQERGGSDAMHISDEELLTQGELDMLFRTSAEVEALKPFLDLGTEKDEDILDKPPKKKSRSVTRNHAPGPNTDRVNVNAFEQFMGSSIEEGDRDDDPFLGVQLMEVDNENYSTLLEAGSSDLEDMDDEDLYPDSGSYPSARSSCPSSEMESEIFIQEWRPLSP